MLKISMAIITLFLLNASANKLEEELKNLNLSQKEVLEKVYEEGKKYNLELTLTAICWEESQFGKYMVNISDPSFGYFHNSVKSIQNRHKSNNWNTSRLIERLLFDIDFGVEQAVLEIKFWQKVYKGKPKAWSKMVSSYNAGYKYRNGEMYLFKIKEKIRALKKYKK